ncbi:MAG: ABC transporter substrate-binding protein [Streptosporangiaceae bacterium]
MRATLVRARLLGVATLIGITMTACGSSGPSGSASTGTTNLTIWSCEGCWGTNFPSVLQQFQAAHPNVKISTRTIPFASYDTTLAQAFAAGSGPDVIWINTSGDYGLFTSKGYLKNISTSIVGAPNVQESDFYPNEWNEVVLPQGTFGIPIDTGTRALYWNKTLFKQAGVAPFGTTVSWQQVLAAAAKINTLGGGISGFRYAGGEKWAMLYNNVGPLVFEAGGQFVNNAATQAYATSAPVESAISYWDQLASYAPKSDLTEQDQSVAVSAFAANKVGMFYNGFWEIPTMMAANPHLQYGVSLMKDVTVDSNTGGWILSVPSYVSSSKIPAIRDLFSYVFAPQREISTTSIMPAVKASTALDKAISGPQYQLFWNILAEHAQQPLPLTQNMYAEATDILTAVQQTQLGHSVPSSMAALQQQLDGLVK